MPSARFKSEDGALVSTSGATPACKPARLAAILLAVLTSASPALASAVMDGPQPAVEADQPTHDTPRHRTFGITTDVGVPDGAALGLVVRPVFDWLRVGAAATYNAMAPGVRVGVTVDPIAFPIAPTLTVEGGHAWEGRLVFVNDAPSVSYNYANFHLGIEIGNRATFRFFLRGGVSWLDGSTAHLDTGTSGAIGNPSYRGWLAPTGKLGFSAYF